MSLLSLRVILLFEVVAAALALFYGYSYLDWKNVSQSLIVNSPDAAFYIKEQISSWWFYKGICVGLTVCVALVGFSQRQEIIAGSLKVRLHWALLFFPAIVVLLYGRDI